MMLESTLNKNDEASDSWLIFLLEGWSTLCFSRLHHSCISPLLKFLRAWSTTTVFPPAAWLAHPPPNFGYLEPDMTTRSRQLL